MHRNYDSAPRLGGRPNSSTSQLHRVRFRTDNDLPTTSTDPRATTTSTSMTPPHLPPSAPPIFFFSSSSCRHRDADDPVRWGPAMGSTPARCRGPHGPVRHATCLATLPTPGRRRPSPVGPSNGVHAGPTPRNPRTGQVRDVLGHGSEGTTPTRKSDGRRAWSTSRTPESSCRRDRGSGPVHRCI